MEKSKNAEIRNKYRELINYLSSLGRYTAISYPNDDVQVRIADASNNDIFKFILSIPKDSNGNFEGQYVDIAWRLPNYTYNIMTHRFKADMNQKTMLDILQFSILNWRLGHTFK